MWGPVYPVWMLHEVLGPQRTLCRKITLNPSRLWRWKSTHTRPVGWHRHQKGCLLGLVWISSQPRKLQLFFSRKPRGFSLENSTNNTNKQNKIKTRTDKKKMFLPERQDPMKMVEMAEETKRKEGQRVFVSKSLFKSPMVRRPFPTS